MARTQQVLKPELPGDLPHGCDERRRITHEKRAAAGRRRELREQRRSRRADRHRIDQHIVLSRAIDEIGRLRVAVAIGTVRQQHQRAASARGLNRVERAKGRVVQRRGPPGVEAIDADNAAGRSADSGAAMVVSPPIATIIT
jgi:hypothetical protein